MPKVDLPNGIYDPAALAQENLRQRLAIMAANPMPGTTLAPIIGNTVSNLANTGVQAYQQFKQKQGLMMAQKTVADYLSMPDEQKALPQNKAAFTQASMALGITPPTLTASAKTYDPRLIKDLSTQSGVDFPTGAELNPGNVSLFETAVKNKESQTANTQAEKDRQDASNQRQKDFEERQKAAEQDKANKFWSSLIPMSVPTVARRGSPLGIAAINNQRKDRLLELAKKDKLTSEEITLMEVDLAGVMQGGSPQEDTLRATHYGNYYRDWASLKGKITGTPQAVNNPDVVNKMREIALGVGQVDNKVISDNLNMIAKNPATAYYIKKDPQGWNEFKQSIMMSAANAQQGDNQTPAQTTSSDSLLDKYGTP